VSGHRPWPPPQFALKPPGPKPGVRGMSGFDGADFIAGTVFGYRWWTLDAPRLDRSPARAEQDWHPRLLCGARGDWQPGENLAVCKPVYGHEVHTGDEIPEISCACGFWAYWQVQPHELGRDGALPVVGVIEGSGQVLTGPLGFRAQKAEIVALHLPLVIEPDLPRTDGNDAMFGRPLSAPLSPWRPAPRFTGRVISFPGAPPVPPSLGGAPRYVPPPPEPPEPSAEEIRAAQDAAQAWMAVIGDRLEQMYPGAEVCETLPLMLAKYPPSPQYTPPETTCGYCHRQVPDLHEHYKSCTTLRYRR